MIVAKYDSRSANLLTIPVNPAQSSLKATCGGKNRKAHSMYKGPARSGRLAPAITSITCVTVTQSSNEESRKKMAKFLLSVGGPGCSIEGGECGGDAYSS